MSSPTFRIYAARAFWEASLQGWVIENGWIRTLAGDRVTSFTPFSQRRCVVDHLNPYVFEHFAGRSI
jgi:hypothetical protein